MRSVLQALLPGLLLLGYGAASIVDAAEHQYLASRSVTLTDSDLVVVELNESATVPANLFDLGNKTLRLTPTENGITRVTISELPALGLSLEFTVRGEIPTGTNATFANFPTHPRCSHSVSNLL